MSASTVVPFRCQADRLTGGVYARSSKRRDRRLPLEDRPFESFVSRGAGRHWDAGWKGTATVGPQLIPKPHGHLALRRELPAGISVTDMGMHVPGETQEP